MAADHGDSSNQAGPEKAEPSEINHSGTESAREMRSEQESDGQGERNPSGNEPAGSNSEASASKAGTPEESAEKTADKEKTGEGGKEGRDGNAGGGGEEVEEDEIDPQNPRGRLLMAKHAKYIKNLDKKTEGIEYVATEHLRMSGAYWGLTAMDLMGRLKDMHSPAMLPWLLSCQQPNGVSVCLSLCLSAFLFSYCAISCLSLLDRTHVIDLPAAVRFIASCQNFDGGFGSVPGGESHAGQSECDRVHIHMNMCQQEGSTGDLRSCQMCATPGEGQHHLLRHLKSPSPIPSSPPTHPSAHPFLHARTQDEERGGISDRPNDMVDVFHTFFGIAGLSLLEYPNLKPVDPAFALPMDVVDRVFRDRELKHLKA
ncbi:unnamed protein product [Closterium sp. NIES-54]